MVAVHVSDRDDHLSLNKRSNDDLFDELQLFVPSVAIICYRSEGLLGQ